MRRSRRMRLATWLPKRPRYVCSSSMTTNCEVLEELEPLRVVRKDRRVEHVRVGDDHLPGRPHDAADVRRRIAVVGVRLQADVGRARQRAQLHELVRRQRLGGEEVERPGRVVLRDRVEDRQVVAERLARCGRRDDHDVLALRHRLVRRRLVRVERLDPASAQRVDDPPVDALRPRRMAWRPRLELAMRGDERGEQRVRQQHGDRLVGVARGRGQHRLLLPNRTSVRSRTIARMFGISVADATARVSQA